MVMPPLQNGVDMASGQPHRDGYRKLESCVPHSGHTMTGISSEGLDHSALQNVVTLESLESALASFWIQFALENFEFPGWPLGEVLWGGGWTVMEERSIFPEVKAPLKSKPEVLSH